MRRFKILLAGAASLAALAGPAVLQAQPAQPRPACDLASFKAPANGGILSVKAFTTPVNYCRVDGYVTTTNPGPNRVLWMLALPENWSGRYLFTVQGGAAGFVPDPTEGHLRQGFAIASTDKGVHVRDFTFRSD